MNRTDGGEVVFETTMDPMKLRGRLAKFRGYLGDATEAASLGEEAQQVVPPNAKDDAIGQLQRLAELRNSGILTDEEFENKKAELLARI